MGIAQTAGNQIVGAFDFLAATSVVVGNEESPAGLSGAVPIPDDAEERIRRLNGVVSVGTLGFVDVERASVSSVPSFDPLGRHEFQFDVIAASPGLLEAAKGQITAGRWFDQGHSDRGDIVAVLGPGAAQRLNISRVDQQPVIFIGHRAFVVIGLIGDVQRQPELLGSVVIPDGTARALYGFDSPSKVQIDVAVGAASLIASQAPVALNPNNPNVFRVEKAPEPKVLRERVEADVNSLFLILGGVSLLVSAIGIANVTLVSVLERVGEIGLKRAVGAERHHISGQFLVEATAMGLVGGIIGASLGVLVVVGVSAVRTWTPVLDASIPFAAPLIGAATGLLAGAYPSFRAASLEPVDALRRGL